MSDFGFINSDELESALDKYMVLDIRDRHSFDSGHINGAMHLSPENISNFIDENDFDTPIVVCCYHGNSSKSAAQFLAEKGFKDVCSLDGGYEGWKENQKNIL